MARGWESKSVEDQIAASEDRKAAATKRVRVRTADDIARDTRRQGLLLSRSKIVRDIENARDDRHRTALRQALDYIDAQIHTL
jgi:hypothetical protein